MAGRVDGKQPRNRSNVIMVMSTFQDSKSIKTVSEITEELKKLLDREFRFVRIAGEVSNLRLPHSGHIYFNLKDHKAQIRAVMFKNQQRYLAKQLADGQQVICDGRISVYEQRGEYQIIIDTVDFHGTGQLAVAFENLKRKLLQVGKAAVTGAEIINRHV